MISLLKLSFLLTALGLSASFPSLCLAFAIASIGLSLSAITVLSKRFFFLLTKLRLSSHTIFKSDDQTI
jgi:hypothetical protein